jgi:hypothetical protein
MILKAVFSIDWHLRICMLMINKQHNKEINMKKIAQSIATLLVVLFLSLGSAIKAQDRGGQGGTDTKPPRCDPRVRVCPPETNSSNTTNSASSVVPQVGTEAPNGQITDRVFFDLLLLLIQLRLGL